MRILQIVHGFPPQDHAGAELVTLYLARALQDRGHQVTIFAGSKDPGAEEHSLREENLQGLPIVHIVNNYTKTTTFRLLYENSFFDESFLCLLDRCQPDVIHFQHLAHLSVSLIPLAASLGYPTVLSLHDFFFPCHRIHLIDAQTRLCPGPERGERCVLCLEGFAPPEEIRRRFLYMEHALEAPELIIVPSAFLARKTLSYFPFLRERLRVVPLGVKPVPARAREHRAGTPLRILYVGLLFPPKGAHVLIEALKGLPAEAIEASLYGASSPFWQPYADRVHAEAQGLPVHFHGPYVHDQLAAILSCHDVLVMPMICEETFSIVTREALMARLPVVAARRGALPEVVQDGVNGLLFAAEDAADLRRCLARLIAEPELVERLRPVEPTVKTMDAYAEEMEGMYGEICAPPYRLRSLQKNLVERYQVYTALSQEHEPLHTESLELGAQNTALQSERDRLSAEKLQAEQQRDQALAAARELQDTLDARAWELREREARLTAIYASTTWTLYRYYTACLPLFLRRPLGQLKQWLLG